MKGLGITKFPGRFCALWLACQLTVTLGTAVAAEDTDSATELSAAEQINQERSAEIEAAIAVRDTAAKLTQEGKYSEAGVEYAKAIEMLKAAPGDWAKELSAAYTLEYDAMKTQWVGAIMAEAQALADEDKYAEAIKKASSALLADERSIDEVDRFITRCNIRIEKIKFDKATDVLAVYPQLPDDQEQIDILFREADILERADRLMDASKKLEKIFLIDPLNMEADRRLRRIWSKLYGLGVEQSRGVLYGLLADGSWGYVPKYIRGSVKNDEAIEVKARNNSDGLYQLLESIMVTADYQDESIFEVIAEQNRNLLREAPDSNASIVTQFTYQVGDTIPKITMQVSNIPLIDLIRYVCMQTNLKMKIDNNAVILGFSGMDDLSTRHFSISADLIHDIAESDDPYYHLGNVELAQEEGSGNNRNANVRGSNLANRNNNSPFGGNRGGAGMGGGAMDPLAMMAGGRSMSANGDNISAEGRISSSIMESMLSNTNEGATYATGVTNGLGSLAFDMNELGLDTSDTDGGDERNEMGQIGAPTPPVTTPRLINYFKARGIDFPNNATITYNRRAGEILVTNTVENLRRMEDLLRQLDEVRSPLVSIEARIVELSELDLQELGFDWALNINTTDYASGESSWQVPNNQNPLRHYAADNENSSDTTTNSYRIINDLKIFPNFGESLFGKNSDVNLSLSVNAISQNSRTEVLSSPHLTATSGDLALIKMVERWCYPESWEDPEIDIDGSTVEITTPVPEFDDGNDLGVVFACRPIVHPDNYTISLYIYPQVTEYLGHENSNYPVTLEAGYIYTTVIDGDPPTTTTTKVPTIKQTVNMWMPEIAVRELEVNVQVYDGATVVLGGMMEQYNTNRDDKWPVLGEIPLIGRLFSSQMTSSEKRNMLIFVTARLINADGTPWRSMSQYGVSEFGVSEFTW